MTKNEFMVKVRELYRFMNTADSSDCKAAEWLTADMAGETGCAALDTIMSAKAFSEEDRSKFYDGDMF